MAINAYLKRLVQALLTNFWSIIRLYTPLKKKVFRGYKNIKWKHWPEMALIFRNSRPDGFCKGGVLKSLAKSTRKHLYQILFSSKVAGLIKNTFFTEHLRATVCMLILYVFYSNLPVDSLFYNLI